VSVRIPSFTHHTFYDLCLTTRYSFILQKNSFNLAPTHPDKCWIIKHCLYWPKSLQVIFCYGSCNGAAKLIRGSFHLDISFGYWFRIIRVPLCAFQSCSVSITDDWRTRRLWIRSLHSWRSWCSRSLGVRRYYNSQHRHSWRPAHRLGTIFISCWHIRIYGVSASELKEF
jgi:hypothetical protein